MENQSRPEPHLRPGDLHPIGRLAHPSYKSILHFEHRVRCRSAQTYKDFTSGGELSMGGQVSYVGGRNGDSRLD